MANILNIYETILPEYKSEYQANKISNSDKWVTEQEIENLFIKILQEDSYEYDKSINNEDNLINNLRLKLESLNNITFTENEWNTFFTNEINKIYTISDIETIVLNKQFKNALERDDGTIKNIKIVDEDNFDRNSFQVINQYKNEKRRERYDVTILINGLPLVHIELKQPSIDIIEAFNQINRYKKGFLDKSCLYQFAQIFIISNGIDTKYFSNTIRANIINELSNKTNKTSSPASLKSFSFTSYWADAKNNTIKELEDFAVTFLNRETLFRVLFNYTIFRHDKNNNSGDLIILRPYQIAAIEAILNRIQTSNKGGYIWHTTGSGKTITSFKAAQLASQMPDIEHVIFAVDRRDLDNQTISEYNKLQDDAVNGTDSTKELIKNFDKSNTKKITVTTIQKLNNFARIVKHHDIFDKKVIFIFDECHRSQFGDMHQKIISRFKHYYLFGFTGTPIFVENSQNNLIKVKNDDNTTSVELGTTESLFGDLLHTYNITDAINDKNVLPFKVDFVDTIRLKQDSEDQKVQDIETEEILDHKDRVHLIVQDILKKFFDKTHKNKVYKYGNRQVRGFNSIFAVSSIDMCQLYYNEFKEQIANSEDERVKNLKITTIFSYEANELDDQTEGCYESFVNNKSSKEFLADVIDDYNNKFDTTIDDFSSYYLSVSDKMKKNEIDILIVVNMFLTGFDAPTINTLYVDKFLKMHGLVQAFSRTNRILNATKPFGCIVCYRNLEQAFNDAMRVFSQGSNNKNYKIYDFESYYSKGYIDSQGKEHESYLELIEKLEAFKDCDFSSDNDKKEFLKIFSRILKIRNILSFFDEFESCDKKITEGEFQRYLGKYNTFYRELRDSSSKDKSSILNDVEFCIEYVKQIEVDCDYILKLIKELSNKPLVEITDRISVAIDSSLEMRSKKELIIRFLNKINASRFDEDGDIMSDLQGNWHSFVLDAYEDAIKELDTKSESISKEILREAFDFGYLDTSGDKFDSIVIGSRFNNNKRQENKDKLIEKFQSIFDTFNGILSLEDLDDKDKNLS